MSKFTTIVKYLFTGEPYIYIYIYIQPASNLNIIVSLVSFHSYNILTQDTVFQLLSLIRVIFILVILVNLIIANIIISMCFSQVLC